jgi:alpha-tubulin suppressor-like RCC1 family protein
VYKINNSACSSSGPNESSGFVCLICCFLFIVSFTAFSEAVSTEFSQGFITTSSSNSSAVAAIGTTGYPFLGYAYADAVRGDVIRVSEAVILEDMTIDRGVDITIKGGYAPDLHTRNGQASFLDGTLTIANGSLTVDGLVISSSPVRVTSIWGGARHCIVLKTDGTVWDWGMNWLGKLGDNTTSVFAVPATYAGGSNDRFTPIGVHGPGNVGYLQGIAAVMGGESHNFALKSDGTVWAWGGNSFGQLGDGSNSDSHTPVQVSGLTSVKALGGRGYHSLALKSDGTVWAWGYNDSGQLGNGTSVNSNVPGQISGLNGVSAVSGGGFQSLALQSNGDVWAWGKNSHGELGDGTNISKDKPVLITGISNVKQISGGWFHTVALTTDGAVWTWGDNGRGQLGDGTTTGRNKPYHVAGLSGVIAVSGGDCHTAALKSDGSVWTWGCNDKSELGNETAGTDSSVPAQVVGLTNIIRIAARDYHNIALKSDGTVWAWGWNINGQLGNGTTIDSNVPVQVLFP